MSLHLKPPVRVKGFRSPDTQRIRHAFYRSLPKAMRYSVESLEPRYLLSGSPIVLTDHTQTANSHGSTTQTVNQYDGQQVASALTSIIGKLSYLGQQIDKTSINNPLTESVIPLLNETVSQITQGSTGFTLGQTLFSNAGTVTSLDNKINSDFTNATANGSTTNLTSATLASDLQTILQADFGSGYTVTDNSTAAGELDLTFSYSFESAALTTPIVLGNAAQQFNLAISQTKPGGPLPDGLLTAQTTVSFDLKADFSPLAADTNSVVYQLNAYQTQTPNPVTPAMLTSELAGDFIFNPNTIEQTALISEEGSGAGGYLPAFGVQFGVMGAGENDANAHVDGAYANNATFDLDVDAQVNFNSSSYTLATLTSAEAAATAGSPYIPYTVDTPVGNAISGSHALTNEATLTLPITVYDDGQSGTGPVTANDPQFISGLGDLTGTFTIQDSSLFNATSFDSVSALPAASTPLVNANTVELAAFGRLTATSIVAMAQNSSYLAGEIDSQQLTTDLPFLNITQGNAYDFATALQNAFVNAMQTTQIVLTATNEPSTVDAAYPSGDPLNLTGSTSFDLELNIGSGASAGNYLIPVTLATDATRTTMAGLVADLNAALSTALTNASLGTTEIQSRLVTNSSGTQLLQLYSSDTSAQYFLYGFTAPATGVLDLGFNQYSNVVAQVGSAITSGNFQLPGVIVQSNSAVTLTDFTSPTSFNISVNGGTAVTVTIPADAYTSETALVAAAQQALVAAGLWDGISQDGVLVQGAAIGGGFGLEFYGGDNVHSLALSNPGAGSNYSALKITTPSSTATSFTLSVTSNGTTTPYTVYVNGNLTNGLLNEEQPNQSVSDLVSDLQQALVQAGALNAVQTQGITVSSATDSSGDPVIQFLAANPGTGSGEISNFTVSAIGSALSDYLGSTTLSSRHISLATSSTTPDFQTVQQLASLLYNLKLNGGTGINSDNYHGILAAAPSYSAAQLTSANGTPSFTFPIDISVSDTSTLDGSTVLPDLTGVGFSFASAYDAVSGLSSTSTISLARSDNLSFDFGVNLIAPASATEVLTTSLPVSQLFTNYFLNTGGIIQFTPDTGVTYTVTLQPNAAGDSTSLVSFLAALNTAIGSATSSLSGAPALPTYLQNSATSGPAQYVTATTDPTTGEVSLVFTTVGGSTRELTVSVPADASSASQVSDAAWYDLGFLPNTTQTTPYTYTSTGGAITASYAVGAHANGTDAASNPDVFTNSGFITFSLPDGTQGTLEIDPIDTSGNTTLAQLVQTINSDILATASLKGTAWQALQSGADVGNYLTNVLPKIIASSSNGSIVFSLNPAVYETNGPWSLTVQPNYLQDNPNSLVQDIGLPGQTVIDTTQPAIGLLSAAVPAPLSLSGTDSFKVSIDGQNYVTVSVNLSGVTSIGGLVQAINTGIANAPAVSFHGINGTFPLSDYLIANVTNGGTQVLIRLIDDGIVNNYGSTGGNASPFPVLENAAIQINSGSGPLATTLGFSSQQLLFTLQGSDGTIQAVSFTGTATEVDTGTDGGAAFTGTAAFGFTDFNIGLGLLNEQAITNVTFAPSASTTINGLLADANAGDFTSADFGGGISAAPNSSSYAVVRLTQLTFPASAVSGLAFGTNPEIEFGYGAYSAYTGPTIASFATLPAITSSEVIYTNTNNMQLLDRLDLASIVHGLERVGDMLSDWMQNGSTAFDSKLFFALQSLVNIDNFGQDFANAVSQVFAAPPSSLEATPTALLQALSLDPSALTFSIQSTGSGSTAQVLLNISFDWAETITETLPLAVDLADLANNVSTSSTYTNLQGQTEYYSSGVINQFLLGLSTIASDPTNPININFSEVSQLAVNLNIVAAQAGVAIQPQAVIQNPASGSFFRTNFLLSGDSLSGDLPAGTGYLQLSDGSFGIDAAGLLDVYTPVLTISTANLAYDSASETITGIGAINGYTITAGDVGSDVLINAQTTAAQNGLYEVTGYNTTTSTWTLTEQTAIGSIGTTARYYVDNGNNANLYYGLATGTSSQFSLQAPLIYDTAAATSFDQATLQVLAATAAPITGVTATSTTLSGSGALVIDGQTIGAGQVGGLVLINTQTDPTQNGLYTVTSVGAHWTLTRSTLAVSQTRLSIERGTVNAGLFFGYDTPTQFAQLIEPAAYTYTLAGPEVLPYTVQAATTSDLGATFTPGTILAPATLTGTPGISINNLTTTAIDSGQTLTFTGIDNVQNLAVGSLVLVKNETNQGQNGVYIVTALGGTDSLGNNVPWVLTRADFADSVADLTGLRVDVAAGYENVGTRWVQTDANLSALDSTSNIIFSNNVTQIYSTLSGNTPWLTFAATGHAVANLPLEIVAVTDTGAQIVIGNDLQNAAQQVTIGDLQAFYTSLNTIDGTDVTLNNLVVDGAHNLLYSAFTPFKPLVFNFNLATYYANGGSNSVVFSYVPDLYDSFVSPSVIAAFQNAFYVGDALDLALFTIQSSISEALAQEFPLVGTSLSGEAEFVENFRSQFTTLVRQNILANPSFPLEDIRNAIYTAAVNEGLLSNLTLANGDPAQTTLTENSIQVLVWDGSSYTAFPFGQYTDRSYYGMNSNGTLYETVPGSTSSITFAFTLAEDYSPTYTTTLGSVDLGDSSIGATITTNTENYTTGAAETGGIILQRKFILNLGFGINATSGFFIFNPTEATGSGLLAQPMVDFGFMAELTGNINDTSSAEPFFQNTYSSHVNSLSVEVADGRIIDQLENESSTGANLNGSNNDNLPSGFYGDVLFDLNFNHPTADAPASLSFLNGRYADVDDLRSMAELGPDATYSTPENAETDTPTDPAMEPGSAAGSIFNFIINADADVDLILQSQQQGLVPATQADLIYDKSYGIGAIGFGLIFNNPAVVGLGNAALGTEEMNDQVNANSSNATTAANAVSDFDNIATEVSPVWRFANRDQSSSLLLANGAQGNAFVDFQNIKINIIDYLGNILYSALKLYEEVVSPLQPYINFLTTPIPGTSAFTSGGITIGTLLGSGFGTFISAIEGINNLISPLAMLAAEDTSGSGWVSAPADPIDLSGLFAGAEYIGGKVADKIGEKVKEKYDEYQKKKNNKENQAESSSSSGEGVSEDSSSTASEKRATMAEDEVASAGSDGTSEMFNKSKKGSTSGDKESADSNKEPEESDSGEPEKKGSFSAGLSGGSILLDALDFNTLTNIYQGIDANLLRIQLPTLNVSYTYTKEIPIEAFPPLVITLGFTIGFDVTINFGWDTSGFFFNTLDLTTGAPTPLFDFTGKFSIGIGLDFGLINVEADVYFQATVSFFWNDVSGTGKLHDSDLQYLINHGDSIFAVQITGVVGFDFSIVLSIPIPLVGPIDITIFSYTYSVTLFTLTFGAVTGQMQLGTVETGADGGSDVLLLNSGIYASQRLFNNTSPVNENFTLHDVGGSAAAGENILVDFDNQYYEEFDGIKQVIGYTGTGSSEIDAGASLAVGTGLTLSLFSATANSSYSHTYTSNLDPLKYAVVDFFGGAGDTVLIAGAGYNSSWGRSRLQGGTGTGTELLEANVTLSGVTDPGVDIIAGGGPAIIYGSVDGGDNIVAGQGPDLIYGASDDHFYFESGFGNDRIYVTGGDNSVSFDGWTLDTLDTGSYSTTGNTTTVDDPILTQAELTQFITGLSVAPITTPLTLSFGPLVESAVTGDSTVFFATDPTETQQIDNWTGGIGGDTYNIYYFAPDQTLTLNAPVESNHVNTFNVYFGNPNVVYIGVPALNMGTINLNDTNLQDILDVDQTFPETVNSGTGATGYSASYLNGRETLNYDTNLLINYNAPNSTIVLGNAADQTDFDPINAASYNVGTIVLVSPIEFESSHVVIKVKNTLDLLYSVNLVGTSSAPASLEIDITNAFPTGESDLNFESGVVLGISTASKAGKPASQADDLGYGTITLNLNSGSLKDVNEVGGVGGTISIINGTLIISALTSIGSPNDIFNIIAGQFVAQTTGLNDISGQNGIYVKSPDDLHITAYGNMNGLSTAAGDIYVDVEGGHTLYYYQIDAATPGAGSLGGNVTLIADNIQPIASFSVTRDVATQEPVTEEFVTITPSFNLVDLQIAIPPFGYINILELVLSYAIQVINVVIGYQVVEVPTSFTVGGTSGASPDSITGSGTLNLWNDSNDANITVGSQTNPPAAGLYLTDTLLGEITPGFATIIIGRASTDSTATGDITVNGGDFNQAADIIFQGSSINVLGSVTNDHASLVNGQTVPDGQLQFKTYGTSSTAGPLDGHLDFSAGSMVIADTINVSAVASLDLNGTFLSEDAAAGSGRLALADGLIQVTSSGAVTIDAGTELDATVGQSSISITGTAVTINPTATLAAADNLTLIATAGMISEVSTPTPNRARTTNLILQATQGISLYSDALNLLSASTTAGGILLDNNDTGQLASGAMNVDSITTSTGNGVLTAGTIALTNVGDINLVRGVNVTAPLIQTGSIVGSTVTLTSTSGAITGGSSYDVSEDDIETGSLSLSASGAIDGAISSTLSDATKFFGLVTQVSSLSASTSSTTAGAIMIGNVGAVSLGNVTTQAGAINLYDTGDITVLGSVSTGGQAILIDTHRLAADGGSILLGQATPTPGIQGAIDAGAAAVTLTSDNAILGAIGFNLISGSYVTLTAWGDTTVNSSANALISVKLDTPTVDATSEKPGKIVLDTNHDLLLHDLQTPLGGDIDVTAESAILGGPGVNLTTLDIDAYSSNVNLTADGTITDDTVAPTTLSGTGALNIGGHAFVPGDVGDYVLLNDQTLPSQNGIYLVSAVSTAGGGSWTLTASSAVNPSISYTSTAPLVSASNFTNDIIGATLTAQSVGNTVLKTDVSDLFATVGGVGSLTVNQDAGFEVDSAVTNDGAITINAGINSTHGIIAAGFINVGTITAGNGAAINLNALGSYIQDPTFGNVGDTSLITGGVLTLTTQTGTSSGGLNTAVATLDATSSSLGAEFTIDQTGDILIDNVNMTIGGGTAGGDFTLSAKSGNGTSGAITVNDITTDTIDSTVNLTSVDSAIGQTVGKIIAATLDAQAATGVTALTDINVLNADVTGLSGGDITITQDHGVTIGQVETPQGSFTLDLAAGGVTAQPESLTTPYDPPYLLPYNVEANAITINTLTGIATALQNLAVYADSVDATATSLLGTGIFIHNYKIHTGAENFIADDIQALTGPVSITSAGNLLAREIEIQADQSGNNITLVTTNGGNILINFVGTGLADAVPGVTSPNFGNFYATSDGLINAVDPATALVDFPIGSLDPVNIVAYGVTFNAQTGIGTPADLSPIITGTLLSAATKTGDINSGESSSTPYYVDGFSTGMGNLGFIKGGGGDLYATAFSSLDGNVNLTVQDGATLFLGTIYAIGNVSLQMDHINFQGGAQSVFGTGVLTIQPNNPDQYVQVNAYFAQTIYERTDTLEVGLVGFEAIFTDFQSIVIGNIAQPSLTYVYYYVGDPFLASSVVSGTTITFNYLETNSAPPSEFQLADLFAALSTQASQGQLTDEDIQDIVDELGFTGDFSSSSFDDSSDSDDDGFFSDAGPSSTPPGIVAHLAPSNDKSPASLAQAPTHDKTAATTEEEDSSWIDRAVVVTASTAFAAKPARRSRGLF